MFAIKTQNDSFGYNSRSELMSATLGNVATTGDLEQPFQWSSEFYDPELGLVYSNYRHYSPTTARWLSRDPIEEMGGLNLYCFCGNKLFLFDLFGIANIILVYDGDDSMFEQWANAIKDDIINGQSTPLDSQVEFDESDVVSCKPAGIETVRELQETKEIKYLGTFGHGRPGELWLGWTNSEGKRQDIKFGIPGFKSGPTVAQSYSAEIFAELDFYKKATIEFYHCRAAKEICRNGKKQSFVSFLKAIISEKNETQENIKEILIKGNRGPIGNKWRLFLPWKGYPRIDPEK